MKIWASKVEPYRIGEPFEKERRYMIKNTYLQLKLLVVPVLIF